MEAALQLIFEHDSTLASRVEQCVRLILWFQKSGFTLRAWMGTLLAGLTLLADRVCSLVLHLIYLRFHPG